MTLNKRQEQSAVETVESDFQKSGSGSAFLHESQQGKV